MCAQIPAHPLRRPSRRSVWIAFALLCGLNIGAESARALDFACVEPSQYKNILEIFDDDPSKFSSYFGVGRPQFPDSAACRALLITGSIQPGDAEALLGRFIASKGWLATLYLSFNSENREEEIKLAQIIRGLWLKTRVLQRLPFLYEPDFAMAAPKTEPQEADNPAEPFRKGLFKFIGKRSQRVRIDPCRNDCGGSCPYLWAAGASRRAEDAEDANSSEAIAVSAGGLNRPGGSKARAGNVWPLPALAPSIMRRLQSLCAAEITTARGVEERAGAEIAEFTRGKTLLRTDPLLEEIQSLRTAVSRIHRCTQSVFERSRLAAFSRICGPDCDMKTAMAKMSGPGPDVLETEATRARPAELIGLSPNRDVTAVETKIVSRDPNDKLLGEFVKLSPGQWSETSKDGKKQQFCSASEASNIIVMYDKSRDLYIKADIVRRKISVITFRGRGWVPLYDIAEVK